MGLLLRRGQCPVVFLCFVLVLIVPSNVLVFCSARRAEASRGCWWSPTGKSRRQARSLRSSLLVQTGEAALTPCAGRAAWLCHQKGCLNPFPLPGGEVQSGVRHFVPLGSEGCSSCCCHHGLAFSCPGEFEIFYGGKLHRGLLHEGLGALNLV